MKLIKVIGSSLLIILALAFCLFLETFIEVDHWGFAVSVNFTFMMVFTLIFMSIFKPSYQSSYFKSYPFERDGKIYRWFGVTLFIRLLRLIGWEKLIRKDNPVNSRLELLKNYRYSTCGSEIIHLLAAVIVAGYTLRVALQYSVYQIHWLILFNILTNIYPVILQRYNRPRVDRVIARKARFKLIAPNVSP